MDNENINLTEIFDSQNKRQRVSLYLYNRVLRNIFNKIKIYSKRGKTDMYHTIHSFQHYTLPTISNMDECVFFLLDKLNKQGLYAVARQRNVIYISWKHCIGINIFNNNLSTNIQQNTPIYVPETARSSERHSYPKHTSITEDLLADLSNKDYK